MGDTQPRRLEERLIREIGLILALCALALFQSTLLLTPLGFPLPLLLILVIMRLLVAVASGLPDNGILHTLRCALYGGLALDVFATTPFGSHALAMLLAATVVTFFIRQLRVEGPLLPLLAMVVAALIYEATLGLIYQLTVAPIDWQSYLRVVMLPSLLVMLIPTLPIFFVLRWAALREE
jgi:rod shape-determining protein MreD